MRTPLLEAEIGVEIHQNRAGSDPDPHDPKVGSFANFDIWGSKMLGPTAK